MKPQKKDNPLKRWTMVAAFIPLIIGLITPATVVLGLDVFIKGKPLLAALNDPFKGPFAKDMCCWQPFFLGFALIPFIAISFLCLIASKRVSLPRLALIESFGLLGILAFTIEGHIAVWYPLYGGGHMSSTAVIAFIFIPFVSLAGMAVGMLVGWLLSLLPLFQRLEKTWREIPPETGAL